MSCYFCGLVGVIACCVISPQCSITQMHFKVQNIIDRKPPDGDLQESRTQKNLSFSKKKQKKRKLNCMPLSNSASCERVCNGERH